MSVYFSQSLFSISEPFDILSTAVMRIRFDDQKMRFDKKKLREKNGRLKISFDFSIDPFRYFWTRIFRI